MTEDLLDRLIVGLTGEELDIIQKLYLQALKLETEFFLAQPVDQQTVVPLLVDHYRTKYSVTIFVNFDIICTMVNFLNVLAEFAIATTPNLGQIQLECQSVPFDELKSTREALSKQYAEKYEKYIDSMLVNQKGKASHVCVYIYIYFLVKHEKFKEHVLYDVFCFFFKWRNLTMRA